MVWLIDMSLGCALTPTGPGGAQHRQGKAGAASSVLYRTNLLPEWPVNCGCVAVAAAVVAVRCALRWLSCRPLVPCSPACCLFLFPVLVLSCVLS